MRILEERIKWVLRRLRLVEFVLPISAMIIVIGIVVWQSVTGSQDVRRLSGVNTEIEGRMVELQRRGMELQRRRMALDSALMERLELDRAFLDSIRSSSDSSDPRGLVVRTVFAVRTAQTALRSGMDSLDDRMAALEALIAEDPELALRIPLMERTVEELEQRLVDRRATVDRDLDRLWGQTRWLLGLVFTLSLSASLAIWKTRRRRDGETQPEGGDNA